jgi:branched-subunit amino acid transport protein
VNEAWAVVLIVGAATMVIKAVGPVLLGGRPLPARVTGVVALAGPALLAALVAINTFGDGRSLVLDARIVGVALAAVAVAARAPLLVAVIIAAAATAAVRAIGAGGFA